MAHDFDVIIVGGGLGGATLARVLAEKGIHVLVLEREKSFRDRIRGELIQPWGVAEARRLGLYEMLKQSCGREVQFRESRIIGLPPSKPRDLTATSPHQLGALHFYHPEMQEIVLRAAIDAGADVRRSVSALEVSPGVAPSVRYLTSEGEVTSQARLVVGADGRTSACRKWAGFTIQHDPERMVMAGVLMTGLSVPENAHHLFVNPLRGEVSLQVPLGQARFRCYHSYYQQEGRRRLSGREAISDFVEASASAGAPRDWFALAEVAGPLASFDCHEVWINHPYRAGITLVGDAAATSDPTFGSGLSLTLRDVRVLSNLLLTERDWEEAANTYAAEHDHYYGSLHRLLDWMTQLLYEPGPAATARRERAFARITEDPKRIPDYTGLGPDAPSDEATYQNLFGEE